MVIYRYVNIYDTKLKLYLFIFPCPCVAFYAIIRNSGINTSVDGEIILLQ